MKDLISRDKALDKSVLVSLLDVSGKVYNNAAVVFVDALLSVPLEDAECIRHGRWISWAEAGNCVPSENRHECSLCHDAAQVLCNGDELLSDYCPNCGAKM